MAYRNGEARRGCNLDRAPDCLSGQIDRSEDTALPTAPQAQKLARRLGISAAVAALVVELSGLGPREARR